MAPEPTVPPADEVEGRDGSPVGRRTILGLLGLGAVGVAFGSQIQDGVSRALAPVSAIDPTGLSEYVPGAGRFRIYTVTGDLPSRSRAAWKLDVGGLVREPFRLTFAELVELPATHLTADFQCVTGWRVDQVKWTGVRLSDLLDRAGVDDKATHVNFTSFDGAYTESLTLEQARRHDVIVAYQMLGKGIPSQHGGPVRLYVAPMYGYKSLKWLSAIEVVDQLAPGYWEVRGYDVDAWVGRSNGRSDDPTGS